MLQDSQTRVEGYREAAFLSLPNLSPHKLNDPFPGKTGKASVAPIDSSSSDHSWL